MLAVTRDRLASVRLATVFDEEAGVSDKADEQEPR